MGRDHEDPPSQHHAGGKASAAAEPLGVPRQAVVKHLPHWPFLYSYQGSRCIVNTAPRKSAYANAEDVGKALI